VAVPREPVHLRRVLLLVVAAEPTPLLDSPVFAVVVMDASAHLPRYGDQFPFPFCIMSCAFSRMAASDAASSSCGLNIKLGSRHRRGNMPRWHVERIARLHDLFAVAVPDGEAPRRDIAPVRTRATVARQPLEQRCEVPVLTDRGEDDGIAVEMGAPVLGRP
jgi:hypothetical protein